MKVVIIGNGIAGINVASALRVEPSVEVAVYAAEPHAFYSRVRLPEVVSGASSPEAIQFYKEDWYVKKGLVVHAGVPVVSIDRSRKSVTLADGSTVAWDYLVLATGASANRPAIPGSDLPGVYALRTMDDALAIRANALAFPESASVVGGGLLGLEAARALRTRARKACACSRSRRAFFPASSTRRAPAFFRPGLPRWASMSSAARKPPRSPPLPGILPRRHNHSERRPLVPERHHDSVHGRALERRAREGFRACR
jgi:glycine/D-amino acid oxidase-like deaminating enzyme